MIDYDKLTFLDELAKHFIEKPHCPCFPFGHNEAGLGREVKPGKAPGRATERGRR
jgi:hypothetical protein